MKQRLFVGIAAIILFTSVNAFSAPEPAVVPKANQWTLNVVFTQPQQIVVKVPGIRKPQRFWYIIITINNDSGKEVPFYPNCELVTDTLQIIPAYKDTRNIVFDKIKRRHKRKYPFLESLEFADNKILQGQDNSKDLAIIWPDFDAKARDISLFLAGLSNETVVVEHPTKKNADGKPEKVYLRKTLDLQYSISGDESLRKSGRLVFKGKRWVMR
ncbi:MAG: hypothetical protein KJ757_03820 [Planctomycetes bacterium]|nr:hypothetical protein [Planctomycetota bacterium]MBU1518603.1 hypothetical protein [Planctomycetota bacterium]MBU2458537.1 hypothetical protein [Planctomycetota bacterium]MBU2596675.1 hypothetical protein [Planctomycetota bacterium]